MGVIVVLTQLGLGLLLITAAASKALDMSSFRAAVAGYRLMPASVVPATAAVVVAAESAVGAALVLDAWVREAAAAAALLLVTFAAGMVVNLRRGRVIPCGCAGSSRGARISWPLVVRNGLLAAAALFVAGVGGVDAGWAQTRLPLIVALAGALVAMQLLAAFREVSSSLRALDAGGAQ